MTDVHLLEKLERHYADIESGWRVQDSSHDYRNLVTSDDNAKQPFHRWFHLKEAFSHRFLTRLMHDERERGQAADGWSSVLDPFSGGGTTCLSALMLQDQSGLRFRVQGIERNPALQIVSDAKLLGFQRGGALIGPLERAVARLDYVRGVGAVPPSSTLRNAKYFHEADVAVLLALSEQLSSITDETVRTILQCVLISSIESVSKLRRDGRALRFYPNKPTLSPEAAFRTRAQAVLADLRARESGDAAVAKSRVVLGDARDINELEDKRSLFGRIVFSPPYPNNIDYTEVYKLENWIIGAWDTEQDMRLQRLATLRSHPSVSFPDDYSYLTSNVATEVASLIDPLLDCIPDDRYTRGRHQLIQGYADDMWRVLKGCRARISSDGRLYCVVGNSVHGGTGENFVVAADVLIGRLAELAGWSVSEVRIARRLTRRTTVSDYVRESIVVLRPRH